MARDQHDRIEVVGIGTQDSYPEAVDFRDDTGVRSFDLLWAEGPGAWDPLGFSYQPSAVLLAPDGTVIERWSGRVEPEEVLAAATSRETMSQ